MTELISKESILQVIKDRIESIEEAFGISHYERSMKSDYLLDILCDLECIKPVNQWISIKDRLPENGEDVLCWYEYFRYGNYNRLFQTYGIGYQFNGHWSGEVGQGRQTRVIAWQPLPEPPKEE